MREHISYPENKKCSKCGNIKPSDEFAKNICSIDGLAGLCKTCDKISKKKSSEKHKDRLKKYKYEWNKKNPEKVREYWQRRYARMKNIKGEILSEDIAEKYSQQNGKCVFCGTEFGIHYHIDHIIPVSRGGTHTPDNIQLLCQKCNLSKSSKTNEEYMEHIGV